MRLSPMIPVAIDTAITWRTDAFGETKMTTIQQLRAQVQGEIITPDHDSYDHSRQGWDLAINQYPAVIVMAESAQDVAAGINFARENGFAVAVQGTGHGVMLPGNDAVLINTSRLQDVRINAEAQTAQV